jgi:transcription-repair coupling factor (superfamily II helicase)
VGYGKTEVALRAAFKAVEAGKQVAVLVPTTVLALQHFNTFQHRFNPFPICVEMLSRFRTPKQMQTTKSGMTKGTVDIVIGTHALISDTIKFNDLGLLIIDEEHRFGVKHKEKIKQIRSTVDVLTLTATPIPRTLHMSMVGIRDFSLINTPPENRLPIETYIMEYNPDIIQESILREVERGGQAFFVHNRVQSIASIATHLGELLPQVRIAVSHGQMPERQLEKVITDFMDHKYDVLVSTMIIESGVDIPNVNTIIINRADVLGLAQLYQLRGRVGRADLQAYGYLFYPQGQAVTEGAQKRLRVIEEFTDLGSGFKIALRDLEIRGAGNMLGPQQYGHIATIGYDLYCQLLEEAIQKLKGEEIEEKIDVRIDLPLEAYLPDNYIPDSRQKISFYKKIANLKTTEGREELEVELQDRFGTIPESVNILLDIAELKHNCQEVGVERISTGEEKIKITFNQERTSVNPQKVIVLIQQDKRISLIPPSQLQIDSRGLSGRNLVLVIRSILNKLQNS